VAENQKPIEGSILGAARTGSMGVITAVKYLPNKKGNARVWVKVKMKSNQ
jgi:hypothetical protein